jgi:hypothetical protein
MSTPGSSQEATISAMPVASHEATSGNSFRLARSGFQPIAWPYVGISRSLGVTSSSSSLVEQIHVVIVAKRRAAIGC